MKKVFYSLMLGLAIVACEPAEYDDSALVGRMDELEGKVDKIAEDLATLQGNVDALKTLSQALKDGKYITSVVQDEATGNYTITFSNDETIFIEKGEQGIQGEQGVQGEQGNSVTVSEINGALYWILEGHNPIPVYKANPVFSSEDGKLYVQFEGEEKYEVGTLTGKSSFFENVKYDEAAGTVTFTLAEQFGGQSFTLAVTAFSLNISTTVGVTAGAVVDIPYTVLGANDKTVVDVFSSGAYVAEVVAKDVANGVVKVTVPSPLTAGNVLVWADNGEGKTSIRKISFAEEKYEVTPVAAAIPVAGGAIEVKGFSNVEFDVKSDKEWLTVVSVKAGDFTITLNAEENTGDARTATVSLLRKGTETVLTSFKVSQEGKAAEAALASLVWSTAVPFGGGADRNMTTDGEYVYVAKTANPTSIKAYSITDGSYVKDVTFTDHVPSGLTSSGTYAVSCLRVLPNTNADVNNGKPVLVGANLTTGYDNSRTVVYVWSNGIDVAPNYYEIDSGTRRLGDKFTVKGTYQAGELWFMDWNVDADATIRVNVAEGVIGNNWGGPTSYATGRFAIPLGITQGPIGEVVVHPNTTFDASGNPANLLATTNVSTAFYQQSEGNAYAKSEWTTDPELSQTYGYNFFKHNDKDYIAYVKVNADRAGGSLNIIEDINGAADFKGTLEAQTNLETYAIDGTGNAGHGLGDCSVAQVNGTTYIAVMIQNIGLSVYKLN